MEWHQAATKLKKQKSYDDFIAAAEYLISLNFSSPSKSFSSLSSLFYDCVFIFVYYLCIIFVYSKIIMYYICILYCIFV